MYSGLCLISEVYTRKYKGEKFDPKYIKNVDKALEFSKDNDMCVMYLSSLGILYSDDDIVRSNVPLYSYDTSRLKMWSAVVCEQVYRFCTDNMISKVCIITNNNSLYKFLIENLGRRGIEVNTLSLN